MLRFIGCVLIFISCTSLGFLKASSYRARIAELESVTELLKLLDMEITYRRDSLARAFGKVSDAKPCWFAGVLKDCSVMMAERNSLVDSWNGALAKSMEECPLNRQDIAILQDLALGLGKSDIKGHRSIMEPAMMRLGENLNDARRQEQKQGKMYRGLGAAAGVVIAVILI